MTVASAEIQHIKQSVDIVTVASRYAQLRKKARGEWDGACKNCGGSKRFVVNEAGWWFCRDCHEKRGDVIELVRFYENLDFADACEWLAGYRLQPAAKPAAPQKPAAPAVHWDTEAWQLRAYDAMDTAARTLEMNAGAPGRAYLEQRGIEEHTRRAWLLGYASVSPPWNKEQKRRVGGPSITIPYLRHDDDRIMAVRYRRIDPNEDRYINEFGSSCVLHGLHLINLNAPTLVLTEGEVNAISIWQAARDLGITVVSIGSQNPSEQTMQAVSWLSNKFPRCITWCDEPHNALRVRTAVESAHVLPLKSPKPNGEKVDANDMLRLGLLRPFLNDMLQDFEEAA